ncbi:MAG TPA: hypothetical protein DCP92_19020 [Nitrospiraceae bacterium]|nr:hypothetical protein [Nitrospiraceae bacterium]
MSLSLGACATPGSPKMGLYYTPRVENLEQILAAIEARKNTLEKHPAWLSLATQGFLIKNLLDLPESEYSKYQRYLDGGTLYIVVHPAYYVFFENHEPNTTVGDPVEALLKQVALTKDDQFLREQERALRDFLEITSTRKRLILLILPGDYKDFSGYTYRNAPDAYARYINSVTNSSESVLYLYSEQPFRGALSYESQQSLLHFLEAVSPKAIRIGGGYVGRCIEDFYRNLTTSVGEDKVTIAGEISAFSPEDLNGLDLNDFLKGGTLNISALKQVVTSKNIRGNSFKEFLRNYKNYIKKNKDASGQKG